MNNLLELFQLEQIDDDLFRGVSQDLGFRSVFGGQVLGQALHAANQTVSDERISHSLHAYFLRPGDAQAPIDYQVRRIRDGRGFTTRHIEAIQNNRPIFDMLASYQVPEEGADHQDSMPQKVPGPEGLKSEVELLKALADKLPERMRAGLEADRPIETRPADEFDKLDPKPRDPVKYVWVRAAGRMPDDPRLHRAVLAYASDFEMLGTSMRPHGVSFFQPDVLAASLDHALWIHRPFRIDDWLLYSLYSSNAHGGRVLVRGQFFTQDGTLVASSTQEGLVRVR
ncbi:acyl-CoA thioesterase II [Alkalilimnicola ehrlichii]|uniref:Acyl-CoA thioesterase 2 n=1 Tax=Alkalilimnicola ehrlichii TaxID=351052 RepID=A0A3E0X1R0_9GAMM|nr:acyl-CoA thioesterase II [Alkalilimnicola ehrlichii]RFA38417.1 acyl-CoA thioesterase II [Alkalilimnicola ehrlichii]